MTRESSDPKLFGARNAAGESCLLYHVKEELKRQGHDVIKKRMWKDGYMVDNLRQYIRTRQNYRPSFCVLNSRWAIAGAEVDYNERGIVVLQVITDIWRD